MSAVVWGSRIVVTPYARLASTDGASGSSSSCRSCQCACTSTYPGTIVFPVTSTMRAAGGIATVPRFPTATIRLSVTTRSAFVTTWSPFIVIARAPRSTTVPVARARGTATSSVTSRGAVPSAPARNQRRPSNQCTAPSLPHANPAGARRDSSRALAGASAGGAPTSGRGYTARRSPCRTRTARASGDTR